MKTKELNPYILLVVKWLNDKSSVSKEELKKNAAAAYAAYATAYAAYATAADADKWMEKHFKLTGESKQDYINAIAEKEDRVDIDWSKAPEGATHYWEGSHSFYKFSNHLDDFVFCAGHWEPCSDIACFGTDRLTSRPTGPQPPVYTQEMSNEGILPSIGVECLLRKSSEPVKGRNGFVAGECAGEEVYITAHFETREGSAMAAYFGINKRFGGVACGIAFEPLPPKQELINGKAYQFNFMHHKAITGLYDKLNDEFDSFGRKFPVFKSKRITLLTPEDKKSSNKGD